MRRLQKTIKREVSYTGVGVNTGEESTVRFKPSEADTGVVFARIDLPGSPTVKASADNVISRNRRTVLVQNDVEVQMTEHLLSALSGLGIDNVLVEINAPEVPAGDGSAMVYVESLLRAGTLQLNKEKPSFVLPEPMSVHEGDGSIIALPNEEGLLISYTINYPVPTIGTQYFAIDLNRDSFAEQIAPSRTFVLETEIEQLRLLGLGKGATYKNTLVIGPHGVIQNELRFRDEFVRHKILDLIGDLSLLGFDLGARIIAIKSGHRLNFKFVELVRAVQKERERLKKPRHLDIRAIQQFLPHRYPFLLVDRIIDVEEGRRVVGIKNVTANEQFFQGHFPQRPIMPGVLVLECMAQVSGALFMESCKEGRKLAMLASVDAAKFRRPVVPGDQLRVEAEAIRIQPRVGLVQTKATVDGELAAEARIMFVLVDA